MSKNIQRGIASSPLSGLLGVAFIILKLCGIIAWSWWWVLAPFWAPLALAVVILGVALGIAVLMRALS